MSLSKSKMIYCQWAIQNKFKWNLYLNDIICIQECEAENAVYQNVAIMHQLQCVNANIIYLWSYLSSLRMKAMIHQ